jgi:hypothetical protein
MSDPVSFDPPIIKQIGLSPSMIKEPHLHLPTSTANLKNQAPGVFTPRKITFPDRQAPHVLFFCSGANKFILDAGT